MQTAPSTPTAEAAALASAASWVLGDDDLLRLILLRLGFPTSLVRAALVCRRWYRIVSRPDFLRCFRDLHPPRLLGFYISTPSYSSKRLLEFVPMLPQHPELATVLNRGSFSIDASRCIYGCRNGRLYLPAVNKLRHEVHNPLHPMRGPVVLPMLHRESNRKMCHRKFLFSESGDEYFWFFVDMNMDGGRGANLSVYKLQGGNWDIHASVATKPISCFVGNSLLVEDKIYAMPYDSSLLVLDLTSSSLSTIMLPDGVFIHGSTLLSRANGSGVIYLVQVKELEVCIWLLRGTHGSTGDWLMVDTFCLRDMCANLRNPNCMTHVYLKAVGDNAEFLFLDMDQSLLFLDVRSRAMRKVYKYTKTESCGVRIFPYMMIWPPIFPVLKE